MAETGERIPVPPKDASKYRRFSAFVRWTTRTGLRIEETLRLKWSDVSGYDGPHWRVTVPGLKTVASQATLPLSLEATAILRDELEGPGDANALVFGFDGAPGRGAACGGGYIKVRQLWQECREFLGVADNPLATLRSFRRSAARNLHVTKGMPIDLVRSYLRHGNIATTMGYLRLTGGYNTEEMQRWL